MSAFLQLWNLAAAVLWYLFLSRRIRHVVDKQDPGILLLFFGAGLLSTGLTMIIHFLYPLSWIGEARFGDRFPFHFIVTGPVEETAKFLCFLLGVRSLSAVKEPQDGALMGAAVGLGFGTLENVFYLAETPMLFLAVRPILCTGGHMVYGAIWGGMFSSAMYANTYARDPQAYRVAAGGLLLVAFIHGLYNSLPLIPLMVLVNLAALYLAIRVFLNLVEHSPYRSYPLEQARLAVPWIRRGLFFNPKSPILNRNLGVCLMYLGRYPEAAHHLKRSLPRTRRREMPWFLTAVCEYAFVPTDHATRGLRKRWGRLTDEQRKKALAQLQKLLANDAALLARVQATLDAAFKPRHRLEGEALAMELRRRKAERKEQQRRARLGSPALQEAVDGLSGEERSRLARRLRAKKQR